MLTIIADGEEMNESDSPAIIKKLKLEDWYASLQKSDIVKLNRYLRQGLPSEPSDPSEFFRILAKMANDDENHEFAGQMALEGLKREKGELRIFRLNEELIEALVNLNASQSAKKYCHESLDIFPRVCDDLKTENGGCLPKDMKCRNRLIDILVGIEKDYEAAYAALDTFLERGLIDKAEWEYRRNSLKIHRLQRTFDGIYTLRPKEE